MLQHAYKTKTRENNMLILYLIFITLNNIELEIFINILSLTGCLPFNLYSINFIIAARYLQMITSFKLTNNTIK